VQNAVELVTMIFRKILPEAATDVKVSSTSSVPHGVSACENTEDGDPPAVTLPAHDLSLSSKPARESRW
jgi:hypothetical protein